MLGNEETRRPVSENNQTGGWTTLHSWIFLGIVAVGLLLIGIQNRYHYLSPLGLGKAYRIDKVFGGIQEFDPSKGWIAAQLQQMQPPPMSGMDPSSMAMQMPGGAHPGMMPPSMNVPDTAVPVPGGKEESLAEKEIQIPSTPSVQQTKPQGTKELTTEEKLRTFKRAFPNFGQDEFLLANDDLYPDWKKNVSPEGNWNEFLTTYQEFIQWWNDKGSPAESGVKLWKDFLSQRSKR